MRVQLRGLSGASSLNGQCGKVGGFEGERVFVKLDKSFGMYTGVLVKAPGSAFATLGVCNRDGYDDKLSIAPGEMTYVSWPPACGCLPTRSAISSVAPNVLSADIFCRVYLRPASGQRGRAA